MPTNGMTIDSLNTVSALTAQDEVPVWDNESSGEPTRKITAQNLTNSLKTLGSLVNTTEMNTAIQQSTAKYSWESVVPYITRADGLTQKNGIIVYFGNVVTINLALADVTLAVGDNIVAKLSKAYPTWAGSVGNPAACGFIGASSATGTPVRCTLAANGDLRVYSSAAVTSTLRVTFCYCTGDDAFG